MLFRMYDIMLSCNHHSRGNTDTDDLTLYAVYKIDVFLSFAIRNGVFHIDSPFIHFVAGIVPVLA